VEGKSDDITLGHAFMVLCKNHLGADIEMHITEGDITTKYGINSQNIITKIWDIVNEFLKLYSLKKSDIKAIIHITDTDGSFISNDKIIYNRDCEKPFYSTAGIETDNKSNIIDRNLRKAQIINRLITTPVINTIPYQIFYMSCNLEHVFHKETNAPGIDKVKLAMKIDNYYYGNEDEFADFLMNSDFSVTGSYNNTWDFIKTGENSLFRHSNLGLLMNSIISNTI
jgi:hypothetical protein